eukprot:CAMPEP_0170639132 /NCGR_PEP_ID=MMETSP0224-20130122/39468_1 /TAXON_ID=285029 /ORGANISM="Togula jolla, Strain CCCM 725" /LENGTH=129 /DNA_ID=CAMNT_0010969431 /DNA_START=44 /DNA_END=430 /DNA_ORIENTATION=-
MAPDVAGTDYDPSLRLPLQLLGLAIGELEDYSLKAGLKRADVISAEVLAQRLVQVSVASVEEPASNAVAERFVPGPRENGRQSWRREATATSAMAQSFVQKSVAQSVAGSLAGSVAGSKAPGSSTHELL